MTLVDVMFDGCNGYVAMVFELMDCNLYEYMKKRKAPLDEPTAIRIIYQILKAIAYMHSKNMFHRDLKPENCMINVNTTEVKLGDFGSTRMGKAVAPFTEYVSTRWYRAPECILTSGSYGKEVDIWAVGCILYELIANRPLFPGKHELDQITRIHHVLGTPSKEILAQFRKNPNTQMSYSFPPRNPVDFRQVLPKASPEFIDLLKQLLTYDPRIRATAHEALELPIFAKLRATDQRWQPKRDDGFVLPVCYDNKQENQGHGEDAQLRSRIAPLSDSSVYHMSGPDPMIILEQHKKLLKVPGQFYNAVIKVYRPPVRKEVQKVKEPDPIVVPPVPKSNANAGKYLQESRLRALERIKEYKKRRLWQVKVTVQEDSPDSVGFPKPSVALLPRLPGH
jgi:renal tumor antigen